MTLQVTSILTLMLVTGVAFAQPQQWPYGPYDKLNPTRIIPPMKIAPPKAKGVVIVSVSTNSGNIKLKR